MPDKEQLTTMLQQVSNGQPGAMNELIPLVYDHLKNIARRLMSREQGGHVLQTTALVHEAYLRLIDQSQANFNDRLHFQALAATIMRRILIDHARSGARSKRGGGIKPVPLDDDALTVGTNGIEEIDLLALNEALSILEQQSPRKAKLVELRYFGGMTIQEAAAVLNISSATVKRDWEIARGLLHHHLSGSNTYVKSTKPGRADRL